MKIICISKLSGRFIDPNPLVGKSPIYDNITIGKSYECPSTQYGFNDIESIMLSNDIDKMTGRRVPIEIHRNSILESIGI